MYMAFNVDVRRGQQSTTRKNLTNDVEYLLEDTEPSIRVGWDEKKMD